MTLALDCRNATAEIKELFQQLPSGETNCLSPQHCKKHRIIPRQGQRYFQ